MDERTLNDLLECSVCLEMLDTNNKVLPCQHTFCRKCLEIIVSSHTELRCPECRVLVDIKIDDLPPNVLLMRILEGMKNASHNQINSTILAKTHTAAQKTTSSTTSTNNTGLTQQQQQHQSRPHYPHNHLHQINNSSKVIATTNHATRASVEEQNIIRHQQQYYSSKQFSTTNSISIPHARAVYDFLSTETGDICFKKGDHILLKKRIDLNWFVGELRGKEGAFPINHVQIIVPLPQPQCKALYDFRMAPNEEEGCLLFTKGAIINVIRRVDHNWAEGRIGETIGIFPIAFVEMNSLAKHIMDSASSLQYTISSRAVPPPPIIDQTSSNDSSSTVTTSPNSSTSSNTSSNSSSAPSSPVTNANLLPTTMQNKHREHHHDKRHSLTALPATAALTNVNLQQTNRHSVEILSSPADVATTVEISNSTNLQCAAQKPSPSTSRHYDSNHPTKQKSAELPASYVAIYPYKPQNHDELELKKGSVYYVTERCQDGWFKGANRSQKSGVFPGNYVQLLRNNRENNQILNLKKQSVNSSQHHHQSVSLSNNQQSQSRHTSSSSSSSSCKTATTVAPPELPPRTIVVAGPATIASSSVWSKPLGQHVEAFFSRKSNSATTSKSEINSKNELQSASSQIENKKEATSSTSSSSSAVNLMKRLTNIKRSKSPTSNNSAYSMDNPVFEDTVAISSSATNVVSTAALSSASSTNSSKRHVQLPSHHPVHVRSGSCPSQLLQSLPLDLNGPTAFGSQRVKGNKDRPTIHSIRNNLDSTNRVRAMQTRDSNASVTNSNPEQNKIINPAKYPCPPSSASPSSSSSSYHRKSQSLDAATISSQLNAAAKLNKTHYINQNPQKERINLRFRCIVSYPPNSEFELELKCGDIVFVHKKRDNGWYKGTHARTGKIGLFPASFVEPDI